MYIWLNTESYRDVDNQNMIGMQTEIWGWRPMRVEAAHVIAHSVVLWNAMQATNK